MGMDSKAARVVRRASLKFMQFAGMVQSTPEKNQTQTEKNREKFKQKRKAGKQLNPAAQKYLKMKQEARELMQGPPSSPGNVQLQVESPTSLLVTFDEPLHHNGAIVTRYKVEWSCFEDFSTLVGNQIIEDPAFTFFEIPGLVQGNIYWVRVRAWNIKGFGEPSKPCSATPSSWREVCNTRPRHEGKLQMLHELFKLIRQSRPADAGEIKDTPSSPSHPRKNTMRKSIKNLFSSAPKFQKVLKRGVYMTSLLTCEDRMVVTNEEHLPIVEVDETFSGTNLNTDFHWLMKIACTWEDVKSLRADLERSSSSPNVLIFRAKLLSAAAQLQSALGTHDLGQFYHTPIKDANGSILLVTSCVLADPKQVSMTHVKWMPFSKLQKKVASSSLEATAIETVVNAAPEMVNYERLSNAPLPRGLYLGYLKLQSSVDMIRIMVPANQPNILPYHKIRDCPNITRDEWQWLQRLSTNDVRQPPSSKQQQFTSLLSNASRQLLTKLGVSEDAAVSHRIYDGEVIELCEDVTMLLLLPPAEDVCSVPGHTDALADRPEYLRLPVQVFEMAHMSTYQYDFISRYARLSSILEMDAALAQQAQREAFSDEELSSARSRVEQIAEHQSRVDEAWRSVRWTMDIIAYARDKTVRGGLPLGVLNAPPPSPSDSPCMDRKDSDKVSSGSSDPGYHSDRSMEPSDPDGDNSTRSGHNNSSVVLQQPCNNNNHPNESSEEVVWKQAHQNHDSTSPGSLRVYSACGAARGACVRLQVTPRTTAQEVLHLVLQQLQKAVLASGSSDSTEAAGMYNEEFLDNYCLVAVIGARERVLRNDFQPLQLQNPWTKGKLYVRLKADVLAALDQGHVTSV